MKQDCLVCDVVSGKIKTPGGILFENDSIAITHSIPPAQCKGFMIVSPKRHIEHIADLTKNEMGEISTAIHNTAKNISKALKPEKVYVCSFGETVKHVHFYVIPRYLDMPASGVEVLKQIIKEGKWLCSGKEAEEVANRIKKYFF